MLLDTHMFSPLEIIPINIVVFEAAKVEAAGIRKLIIRYLTLRLRVFSLRFGAVWHFLEFNSMSLGFFNCKGLPRESPLVQSEVLRQEFPDSAQFVLELAKLTQNKRDILGRRIGMEQIVFFENIDCAHYRTTDKHGDIREV